MFPPPGRLRSDIPAGTAWLRAQGAAAPCRRRRQRTADEVCRRRHRARCV